MALSMGLHIPIQSSILACMRKFPEGQVVEYSVNIIAENMYTQCDTEENHYLLLDEIIDWQNDEFIPSCQTR
jgi:hypothetical protein